MSRPIIFWKELTNRPTIPPTLTSSIVTFAERPSPDDWIGLHGHTFLSGANRWSAARFQREITARDWFSPQQMWWAIDPTSRQTMGVVTLEATGEQGRIHWLMVPETARRQRVASALLGTLEQAAWDLGVRQLSAETLSSWTPAVAFYRRQGYETVLPLG